MTTLMADKLVKVLSEDQRVKIGETIANDLVNELEDYLLKGMVNMSKDFSKTGAKSEYSMVLQGMRRRLVERLRGTVEKVEKFNG